MITILIPITFGWWLFVPMSILYIYLAKLPYELVVAGAILDSVYYFGENFMVKNQFTLFAVFLILVALFLKDKVNWKEVI